VEAFWSINYKYRVSWECAELLIELGSGSGGGDGGGGDVISAPPSAATTSVSAPAIQQHLAGAGGEGTVFDLK
jgi:serine/arginine repetitive matrix protein 2